jgi:DNA-binding response OmpR family regulator
VDILLVEDNEGDAFLVGLAVAQVSAAARLRVAHDGEVALAILQSGDFRPSLIILDLNLPRIPGLDLLTRWRGNTVPIVVFTSSSSDYEKARVLALGASEFVQKPSDLDAFIGAVGGIIKRWGAVDL